MTARCNFVILNLWGLANSRKNLPKQKQRELRYRHFVHDVDPCLLDQDHGGAHLLSTMRRPDDPEVES